MHLIQWYAEFYSFQILTMCIASILCMIIIKSNVKCENFHSKNHSLSICLNFKLWKLKFYRFTSLSHSLNNLLHYILRISICFPAFQLNFFLCIYFNQILSIQFVCSSFAPNAQLHITNCIVRILYGKYFRRCTCVHMNFNQIFNIHEIDEPNCEYRLA